jgi:hypothetical protein
MVEAVADSVKQLITIRPLKLNFRFPTKDSSNNQGRNKGRGAADRAAAPKTPDFVDIMISKVLRDLPFSRNHPLEWADD